MERTTAKKTAISISKPIVFSIFAHLILVILLVYLRQDAAHKLDKQHKEIIKAKQPAVQSYLYVAPKKLKSTTVVDTPTPSKVDDNTEQLQSSEQNKKTEVTNKEPLKVPKVAEQKPNQEPAPEVMPKPKQELQPELAQEQTKKPTFNAQKAVTRSSAMSQLNRLRSRISSEQQQKAFEHYTRERSLSGMHDNPESVPHSIVPLTTDEKKEQSTTKYSGDIAITKHDNGTCSITEDLSRVGMEGHKAVSMFACGESAFDKAFRQHMEKVSKKLKPIKR